MNNKYLDDHLDEYLYRYHSYAGQEEYAEYDEDEEYEEEEYEEEEELDDLKRDAISTLNSSCIRRQGMQEGDLKSLEATAKAELAIKTYQFNYNL